MIEQCQNRAIRPLQIHIGEETWIGERAIVMADVGSHRIVGAGTIVKNL
jgi:acetyltransferase-like isoleucine patch superfamily enzyme